MGLKFFIEMKTGEIQEVFTFGLLSSIPNQCNEYCQTNGYTSDKYIEGYNITITTNPGNTKFDDKIPYRDTRQIWVEEWQEDSI